jgi:uncharacterized membrane protein YgdD (TMEM256/DUF423 family)
MNQKQILLTAVMLGFLSVALGAFGAHALKDVLEQRGRTETFELAVRYQFYHTLVLVFIGMQADNFYTKASAFFLIGIFLFSGSLYFLAFTNSTALVLVTPVGGLFLLTGWAWFGWNVYKKK